MSMFGDILNLVTTGVGLAESLNRNDQMQDIISRGTDTSDIRAAQLATSKSLFDLLYGNNPAMQADLQQMDVNFLQPSVTAFRPAYDVGQQRFMAGDAYAPETLRALLQERARQGIADTYDNLTNTVAMQALRTGTNAAETMKELARQRARDTTNAFRDAELSAITGAEQLNLARQESGQKALAASQGPLLDALKTRSGIAGNMFLGNAQTRDTAARGMFNNIGSAYGNEAYARAGGVGKAMDNLQEQPWGSAINLGGQALERLFNRSSNAQSTPRTAPASPSYPNSGLISVM